MFITLDPVRGDSVYEVLSEPLPTADQMFEACC